MNFILGTAQFGLNYGVSNVYGKTQEHEVKKILDTSLLHGFRKIDTAIDYGDSESVLGKVGIKKFEVITKINPLTIQRKNAFSMILSDVENSLRRLKIDQLEAVLIHNTESIVKENEADIFLFLNDLKKMKLTKKIGISTYSTEEIIRLCGKYDFDIAQTPLNVIDTDLITSGCIETLKKSNIEVHVRSIFLQGLLLMKEGCRPKKFNQFNSVWNEWHNWLNKNDLTPLEGCLCFINNCPLIDGVIVGVENSAQLIDIVKSTNRSVRSMPNFPKIDPLLLNPSKWTSL
jgi:aryl-alcohol dehydrogenase-like predicted oxidoreductase